MRPEELSDAIGNLDERFIESADKLRHSKKAKRIVSINWGRWVALAACLCLVAGLGAALFGGSKSDMADALLGGSTGETCTVTTDSTAGAPGEYDDAKSEEANAGRVNELHLAVYPEAVAFPDELDYTNTLTGRVDHEAYSDAYSLWWQQRRECYDFAEAYSGRLDGFYATTVQTMLGAAGDENLVYSPVNIYLALCMLAETTGEESRAQVLALLGLDSVEEARAVAGSLFNANYSNDGATTSLLANSIWLDDGLSYNDAVLQTLAQDHYASSFSGEMGSAEYNARVQRWLDEQTGGLLSEQAQGIEFGPETSFALASTVYYNARWASTFAETQTASGIFHSTTGDVDIDFMHQSSSGIYYWGDGFSAVSKSFDNGGGSMWFILPDEGVSISQLVGSDDCVDFIVSPDERVNNKHLVINMAVPKFDVASDIELRDSLRAMGVTEVFDSALADFSPLMGNYPGYLSSARHAARVLIDEEGVEAAAYTVLIRDGGAMPPTDEVDFVLDRPFIFVLRGIDGEILFIGVVNQP